MDPILRAEGITKSFRSGAKQIDVLTGVDFAINKHESASIRGGSGSGKTTLLNILAGLEVGGGGKLFWRDQQVDAYTNTRKSKLRADFLGMVFQAFYLVPELNALENVLLPARIHGTDMKDARERAENLLGRVGLSERLRNLPTQLSGGERQRVGVARALMNRPELVFADEPTGNLDERTAGAVMDLLLEICEEEKTSLVIVTHSPEFAERTGQQYFLHDGVLHPGNGDPEA